MSAPYRPSQWGTPAPQRVLITFPGQGGAASPYSSSGGSGPTLPTGKTNYAFDAVIVAGHKQDLRKTEHPVQSGASISDHAYLVPAQLVLDVGVSDAMDAYFNPSTWTGNSSKSVAAYQTLLALQASRIPLTVVTRLRTYTNMIIESLPAEETVKTFLMLRARVVFGQIIAASVSSTPNSARPQDTQSTNLGVAELTGEPVTSAQQSQNNVSGGVPGVPKNVIGAGNWSSVNSSVLGALKKP